MFGMLITIEAGLFGLSLFLSFFGSSKNEKAILPVADSVLQ